MTPEDFVALYRGYWPRAQNVAAPRMRELWGEVTERVPDEVVGYGLKRYARGTDKPPTVVDFERYLWGLMDAWAHRHPDRVEGSSWMRWRRQVRDDAPDQVEIKPCEGCRDPIRFTRTERGLQRFPTDGGLVYKLVDGAWFAARCPVCGGPEIHRRPRGAHRLIEAPNALPLPDPDAWKSGDWVPLADCPGGDLRRAAEATKKSPVVKTDGAGRVGFWPNDAWKAFFAWKLAAVESCRRWYAERCEGRGRDGGDDPVRKRNVTGDETTRQTRQTPPSDERNSKGDKADANMGHGFQGTQLPEADLFGPHEDPHARASTPARDAAGSPREDPRNDDPPPF